MIIGVCIKRCGMAESWMSEESLGTLRMANAAWKLLAADDAPLCCSFFYDVFIRGNKRNLPEEQLVETLKPYLYRRYNEENRPDDEGLEQEARADLKTWANESHQWLRRFYRNHMTCYDLTTSAQKAVEWLDSLKGRQLIGTESRLHLFFHLLHEIEHDANPDKIARRQYLEAQKLAIEKEIADLDAGGTVKTLDDVQVQARFQEAIKLAKEILSDFREVKDQFQEIYETFRKEMNEWEEGKGVLLSKFLESRDLIEKSDQGKSFRAFFDYLMQSEEQRQFDATVKKVIELGHLGCIAGESDFSDIKGAWLDGAEDVQLTLGKLSEQISWYVNERNLEEKRQIYFYVKSISQQAASIVGRMPKNRDFMSIPEAAPEIELPMERPLRMPPAVESLSSGILGEGRAESSMSALFQQVYVDKKELRRRIRMLRDRNGAVTLAAVIREYPVKAGLLEILTYLEAAKSERGQYVAGAEDRVPYTGADGAPREISMERIVFRKKEDKK